MEHVRGQDAPRITPSTVYPVQPVLRGINHSSGHLSMANYMLYKSDSGMKHQNPALSQVHHG